MTKKILILVNHDLTIYNFRKEIVEEYISQGFEVYISSPYGNRIQYFIDLGCHYIETKINRHGMNPITELKLLIFYKKIMKEIRPDAVQTYTIKPNIYGGIAAKQLNIPYISNVTGFGGAIQGKSLSSKIIERLYSHSQRKAYTTFFQNQNNLDYALANDIVFENYEVLNGSGVNLEEFLFQEYCPTVGTNLLYAGRIMKDKGIRELLEAMIILKGTNIKLKMVGFLEDKDLMNLISDSIRINSNISYQEFSYEIDEIMAQSDAIILPSYHEGMSNLLLEGAAVGRPLLASNIPGCKEIVVEYSNGYLFEPKNVDSIVEAIKKFDNLSNIKKSEFGRNSRLIVEEKFDRNEIVKIYLGKIMEMTHVK